MQGAAAREQGECLEREGGGEVNGNIKKNYIIKNFGYLATLILKFRWDIEENYVEVFRREKYLLQDQ